MRPELFCSWYEARNRTSEQFLIYWIQGREWDSHFLALYLLDIETSVTYTGGEWKYKNSEQVCDCKSKDLVL